MKSAVLALVLFVVAGLTSAQQASNAQAGASRKDVVLDASSVTQPVAAIRPVTYADRYCAGFVTREKLPATIFLSGSPNSPHATKLGSRDLVYITGPKLREGMQFSVVRQLRDPNRFELFRGQHALMRKAGQPYAEVGRVRVVDTRQKMAVGIIEFACKAAIPGDLLIPFTERPEIAVAPLSALDRFAPSNGNLTGRIVMAQDFDSLLGVGQKVYLTVGAEQHVKVGDVFRIFRSPQSELHDEVDALSYKSTMVEDSQKNPMHIRTGGLSLDPEFFDVGRGPKVKVADLPRQVLGKVVVLNVTPSSATGMITVALEDIHAGDGVEAVAASNAAGADR